ncbi:hypothetical protein SAMN05216576_107238 [Ectopseudomonas chengduensis]|uniref:Uncharacterized protein n=2 Tax=Ectopseudomonas TaxID=3236654 RepID=A0A1G6Q3N7_9GAMM|nr:hypothetical protein DW68_024085 [Pseudomonas mendocina S5.2]KER98180.1 hypothetical protein HN51_25640 [Pseudomonas mendocina]OEO24394.1 hypothetical protein AX279_17145 [Pseudomonas sp. J237]CRN66158.1 hypothetical protein PAERUG_P40_Scotland_4_VIM_2_09_12_04078 [Pseudomonas aeruginosa]SDC86949.1 hypothetical protein SAMN05216576_107238 [Pseudomonas chengduensis]
MRHDGAGDFEYQGLSAIEPFISDFPGHLLIFPPTSWQSANALFGNVIRKINLKQLEGVWQVLWINLKMNKSLQHGR